MKKQNQFTTAVSDESSAFAQMINQAKAAEKYIIGCLLTESSAISRVAEILSPECFYDSSMSCLFQTISKIWEDGQQPDLMNVTASLLQQDMLDKVGGPYEISQLSADVGSTSNLEDHAMFVRQCYTQRMLATAGATIQSYAMDLSQDVGDQVVKSMKVVEDVLNGMDYSSPMLTMAETTKKALDDYRRKEALRLKGNPYGLKSGIATLDKYIHGFKPGELIVVGARPAMGKTAMLLHFARSIGEAGNPIAIFSLEMSDISLTNRLIYAIANFNRDAYKDGWLTPEDKEKVYEAADRISQLPIMVDESPNLSVQQIKVRAMNLKKKRGLSAIGIDYLQLMNMKAENKSYNREQEISQTTRKLKQLAKELEVPIILLSQLNRNIEQKINGGVKVTSLPKLSDLRESGAIEQDADVVLLLHRPEYYGDTDAVKGIGLIVIAKQRDGKTGKVQFSYSEDMTRIKDIGDEVPF